MKDLIRRSFERSAELQARADRDPQDTYAARWARAAPAARRRRCRTPETPQVRDLLVDALAVARLTRLVTDDTLPPLDQARRRAYEYVQQRHGAGWAEGITCPWCVSVHLGLAAVVARRVAPRAWSPIARALALSYAAGWLNTR